MCTEKWVDEHLPSLNYKTQSRKMVRPSSTVSSVLSAAMCRDIRLRLNPDLQIVRENAFDSKRQSSDVTSDTDTLYSHGSSEVCEAADISSAHEVADDTKQKFQRYMIQGM